MGSLAPGMWQEPHFRGALQSVQPQWARDAFLSPSQAGNCSLSSPQPGTQSLWLYVLTSHWWSQNGRLSQCPSRGWMGPDSAGEPPGCWAKAGEPSRPCPGSRLVPTSPLCFHPHHTVPVLGAPLLFLPAPSLNSGRMQDTHISYPFCSPLLGLPRAVLFT